MKKRVSIMLCQKNLYRKHTMKPNIYDYIAIEKLSRYR